MIPDLVAAPLVPWPLIIALAGLAVAIGLYGLVRRARGAGLRLIALAVLVLALVNPRLATESRLPLDDVAVVLVDDSDSQAFGDRRAQTAKALQQVEQKLAGQPNLEIRIHTFSNEPGDDRGTAIFRAVEQAVADIPRRALAGIVMITDGRSHDRPSRPDLGMPVHVLLTGTPDERDRRLVIEQAPGYGLVGQSVRAEFRVVDEAGQGKREGGSVRVMIRRDGTLQGSMTVALNRSASLDIPITHGGATLVELEAEKVPGELTLVNNRAAMSVSGVRDRLRVLLISGEPHQGERMWRNLLKADPSVDLVHFTILRPPEKDDNTPLRELALISFPTRELFEEKLHDFDLVIFDRYRRRGVLPQDYYLNLKDYVKGGGAMLVAHGAEYNDPVNLYDSPLAEILPAAPAGRVLRQAFHPALTATGARHPVTAGLDGSAQTPPAWGRWLQQVAAAPVFGHTVMRGVDDLPLVQIAQVDDGRVAQLFSDTAWLWARGFEGGGPHADLFRRLAHWLMKEPALEEEQLSAEMHGADLHILRRSLAEAAVPVRVELPDGSVVDVTLADQGDGSAKAVLATRQPGLYRVQDGSRTAIAASGSSRQRELTEVTATDEILKPIATASNGSITWLSEDGVPEFRRTGPDSKAAGRGWIGLRENHQHRVTGITDTPLLPGGIVLLLGLGGLLLAWRREGK